VTPSPVAASPFSLGVGSFDPLPDRVLLWTRLDGGGPCRWEVATDPDVEEVVAHGTVDVDPAVGTVAVDATGLSPGTRYWYRFVAGAAVSPVGRTRTLPVDADGLRLGVACCARFSQSPFTVYAALADADVDLVVHLGDYIYEDTKAECEGREPDPPHECVTLDDYRRRHAQARRDPDLQALHARHPMVVVWDDHDIADNAWRGGAQSHDDDEHGPWAPRLQAALQAHQEHLPKRLADPTDLASAWRRLDAGALVSIVCTETRAHRDQQAGADDTPPVDDPGRTMLGPAQARWLREAVTDPTPTWLLVPSGTVVSELVIEAPDALDGVLPEKYAVVDGEGINTDQWDGYLAERTALVSALDERGGGTIILSGDIHSSWAIEGPRAPDGRPVAVELVCPPAATTPLGQLLPPGVGARLGPAIQEQLTDVRWVDVDHHGYLLLDLRRDRAEVSWWWVDPGDAAAARLGRRWTVPATGPARLVDPEPRPAPEGPPPSPLSARRSRRRLVVVAGGAVVALGAVTVGRRLRRRAAPT
jgi:alkaline phosphatase D